MIDITLETERFNYRAYGVVLSFIDGCIELAFDVGYKRYSVVICRG